MALMAVSSTSFRTEISTFPLGSSCHGHMLQGIRDVEGVRLVSTTP